MFLFGRSDEDKDVDPARLTAIELATLIEEGVMQKEVPEAVGLEITDELYKKALDSIERFVFKNNDIKAFTKDNLLSYRKGIYYGLALASKLTSDVKDVHVEDDSVSGVGKVDAQSRGAQSMARKYAFIFWAIERAKENWTEDDWFKNLMRNAKVEEAPKKTKPKK